MKKKILCGLSVALLFCNVTWANTTANTANTSTPRDATKTQQVPITRLKPTQETPATQPKAAEVAKTLQITDVWARKSMSPNNNSAAYMKINNPTEEQITIIGASASSVANNVELHKSFADEKGISRMTSIDKIVIPAKSSIELKPGAIHIMLFDLKKNLSVGNKFDITIKIEGKAAIILETIVK